MVMLHAYQIKGSDVCSNMVSTILLVDTSLTPGVGSKGQNIFFLKVIMLHIKIKGIEHRAPCKHIFCLYTHPWPLGWDQKVKTYFFFEVVLLHIKLKGIERRAPCKH